jgi:hypothetical protein
MDLRTFHERVYGKIGKKLYVFEPTWESFRPISGIGWNGTSFVPLDSEFKKDIFSSEYGFGTLEERAECRKLTQETDLSNATETTDALSMWRWYGETKLTWWRDRPCMFSSPCV